MRRRKMSEYDLDLDDENSGDDTIRVKNDQESDEDTEDASETDMVKQEEEYTEIKEQMYQDKLSNLKKQLQLLHDMVHPEYLKRLKKLEHSYHDRLLCSDVFQYCEVTMVEREFEMEQEGAFSECEEKKHELKDSLLTDLEEKKRLIEMERITMELTGDSMEVKPVNTRKLRRRPNDPLPLPEKRRKTSPTQLNFLLEEHEIMEDLKIISKGKYQAPSRKHDNGESYNLSNEVLSHPYDVRVEDGKLYYDRKWFHRGQTVYYEGKEVGSRCSGSICTISPSEIWIRRMPDNMKFDTSDTRKIRITISQLQKGRCTIKKRPS